jgi:hypothetical protein
MNVFHERPISKGFIIYAGAGAGLSDSVGFFRFFQNSASKINNIDQAGVLSTNVRYTNIVIPIQFIGGGALDLSDTIILDMNVRWVLGIIPVSSAFTYQTQSATLGLRFKI